MEDKIEMILGVLREAAQIEFSRLLAGLKGIGAKLHAVMTLLASLELTRRRRLFLRQVRPFSELWLFRRELEPGGEEEAPATPDDAGGPIPTGASDGARALASDAVHPQEET
jgi:chromatin segregation and condensation protein Rec8/ScpA/Scc1 (kleisin family)